MKRPAAVMQRPACHKRPAANVASSRRSGSEVEKVPERVADTAPDWLVEPDPTAQLYVFLVTAAKLVNGKDKIESSGEARPPPLVDTASSNLTVYKLKPVGSHFIAMLIFAGVIFRSRLDT